MSITISILGHDKVTVSNELRDLMSNAYSHQGTVVTIPANVVMESCADLSSKTATEILAIRRRERAISAETLSFSFA